QTVCLLSGLPNLDNPRHSDCKGRATTGLALDRDIAAHHLTKASADREAEPGAAVLARGGGGRLRKLLEKLAHLLCRHTDARVRYRQGDPLAAILLSLLHIDADGAAVGELVGIAHEVQQCLT